MKEKCDSMKNRLHLMIVNWEKSGNGGLQHSEMSDDWGHFDLENVVDGDNRASFLIPYDDGRLNTDFYLLYFWERLDKVGFI